VSAARIIEIFGVGLIATGILVATILSGPALFGHGDRDKVLQTYKIRIGRAMLLGLEVLMAAGIVKSVALDLTLATMFALVLLVLVRTTLSWSLVIEVDGRMPWRHRKS